MNYNFIEIAQELESMVWEIDESLIENYGQMFLYKTNGAIDVISCCGIEVYNSEATDLDLYYDEDKEEYISQTEFIKVILNESMIVLGKFYKAINKIIKAELMEKEILNMKRWVMPRGTGKTTQMIYESAKSGAIIVVHNKGLVVDVMRKAEDLGLEIPRPTTFSELIDRKLRSDTGYIIDEIDCCLRGLDVVGYSYSEND